MRPHPRTRKTIKWAGAAATLLLLAVWTASGWRGAACCIEGGPSAGINRGCLTVVVGGVVTTMTPAGTEVAVPTSVYAWRNASPRDVPRHEWWIRIGSVPGLTDLQLPLWLPTLPLLLTTAAAWRLDTRARRRLRGGGAGARPCPSCNYDLTGLSTPAPCPECGARRTSAS